MTNKYRHGEQLPASYDLSAEYKEQIEPLLDALHTKCCELGIPLLTFCTSKRVLDETEDTYQCAEACHTLLSYSALHGPSGLAITALRNALTDDPNIVFDAQKLRDVADEMPVLIEKVVQSTLNGEAIATDSQTVTH